MKKFSQLKSVAKPLICSMFFSAIMLPAIAAPTYYSSSKTMPFSDGVLVGNTLYMSGQIGIKEGKLVKGGVANETKQIFTNMDKVLAKFNLSRSDLVKCSVMIDDMDDFAAFNKAYLAELQAPYPTRSAFAVNELALGASVEIECLASR